MTRSRRTFLTAGATGVLALSAGCLDFITGDGPLEFEAERAAPTDAALDETDFAEYEIREETLEETVEQAGVERDVRASYWISAYTRDVEIEGEAEEGAGFVSVSTPDASVAGRSFNPIAEMDNDEIIEEFGDGLDGQNFGDVEHEETTSLSVLGENRDVDRYLGGREYEGESVEVEILVSSFEHEDDHLVVLGTYPRMDSLREAIEAAHGENAEGSAENADEGDFVDAEGAEDEDGSTPEAANAELPDDLSGAVETLFEELEHPV